MGTLIDIEDQRWDAPLAAHVRSIVDVDTRTKPADATQGDKSKTSAGAKKKSSMRLRAGTAEFETRRDATLKRACEKYAWVAQHEGFVLRKNPLKQAPLKGWVYDRIAKADYAFPYIDRSGHKRIWYPDFNTMLQAYYEPQDAGEIRYDEALITAERIEFLPGQPELTHDVDECRVLNLWRPPDWKEDDNAGEPTLFLQHLVYLLDDDQTAIDHVLNFIAHLIQCPQERVGHALLITSEAKGIGKSTLGIIVRRLVGERNSRVAQTKDLKSSFDGWLVGKLIVQVDEVYEAGNWDLTNKLKPLITEPTVSANIKYGPQIEVENFARFLMFSNNTSPLNIEDGDRRYFVFDSKAQPRGDDYYDALHRYVATAVGMNEIYTFLKRRNLASFNPHRRPPMTHAKHRIIGDSQHPLREYIISAVASGHFKQTLHSEFSWDALQRQLGRDGYGAQAKNMKEVGLALEQAGVTQTRRFNKETKKKQRVYRLPESIPQLTGDWATRDPDDAPEDQQRRQDQL
jgi:hypothetical protein